MADRKGWIDDNMFIHELGFLIGNKEEQQKLDDALITPPVESVEPKVSLADIASANPSPEAQKALDRALERSVEAQAEVTAQAREAVELRKYAIKAWVGADDETQRRIDVVQLDIAERVLQTEITRSQSELIDRLLAEMPKERKVPSFSLLSRSFKKVDVSMAFDGGYNRSLSEVKSILLKAREGL